MSDTPVTSSKKENLRAEMTLADRNINRHVETEFGDNRICGRTVWLGLWPFPWRTVTCSFPHTNTYSYCSIFNQTTQVNFSVIYGEREIRLVWDVAVFSIIATVLQMLKNMNVTV